MSRLIIGFLLILLLAACSQQDKTTPVAKKSETKASTEMQVIVPDTVKAKWSEVKLAVTDRESGSDAVYTVAIGGSFVIPGSTLKVDVKNFLPNFIMSGGVITSRGCSTENPAAQVAVSDQGKQLYDGWLFSLYPQAHSFVHPRYGLNLKGFVAKRHVKVVPLKKG